MSMLEMYKTIARTELTDLGTLNEDQLNYINKLVADMYCAGLINAKIAISNLIDTEEEAAFDPMQCKHEQGSKPKLVAWATTCQGQHEQGFRTAWCCVDCGEEMK